MESERYGTFGAERVAASSSGNNEAEHLITSKSQSKSSRVASYALALVAASGVAALAWTGGVAPSAFAPSASTASTSTTTELEQQFMSGIDRGRLRDFQHRYSSSPHVAGSQQDFETALFTKQQFESFGLQAEIKEYYTLLSTPVRHRLAIVEPASAAREINMTEAGVPGDACTTDEKALPPFLAYSATGNVTGSVVFANFGRPEDFQWLVDHNVTLEGKIALVRYGGNYRGLKVMVAEEHGMAGALVYSDPKEDGFVQGPVYPDGPWRPEDSFQRGAVIFLSLATGDPLTPGFASVPGAPYLKYEDAKTIPHIPALPLSYGQAKHILASLGGVQAPDGWQGGLSFPDGYHIGDDEKTVVNLDVEMDNKVSAIWDVIGKIPGELEPDRQVILGNHRDAWVCGAVDPSSGSAALLEIAHGLGELLKTGWKPRRTLVLGSWDGEEPGLLGSTEYAEDLADELKQQAVAYLNVDAMMGPLVSTGGTPSIADFLIQTAKAVPANTFYGNETETSLYEQWVKQAADHAEAYAGTLGPDHLITLLGSGTDYTPFYQHLGIISANIGFSLAEAPYGVYHSSMDSLMYSEKFADPLYATHETTAQWWGLLGIRLADAELLPFDFSTYALVMREDLEILAPQTPDEVDFAGLYEAVSFFEEQANSFHRRLSTAESLGLASGADPVAVRKWNDKMVQLERFLISDAGLPHRTWYKHVIFGPGFYEGYAGTAFPGISDCIAFKDDAATTQKHVDEVARVITDAGAYLASD